MINCKQTEIFRLLFFDNLIYISNVKYDHFLRKLPKSGRFSMSDRLQVVIKM